MPKHVADIVVDVVYRRSCADLGEIVDAVARELGRPRGRVERVVSAALTKLVKRGVVVRKRKGYYCAPTVVLI